MVSSYRGAGDITTCASVGQECAVTRCWRLMLVGLRQWHCWTASTSSNSCWLSMNIVVLWSLTRNYRSYSTDWLPCVTSPTRLRIFLHHSTARIRWLVPEFHWTCVVDTLRSWSYDLLWAHHVENSHLPVPMNKTQCLACHHWIWGAARHRWLSLQIGELESPDDAPNHRWTVPQTTGYGGWSSRAYNHGKIPVITLAAHPSRLFPSICNQTAA